MLFQHRLTCNFYDCFHRFWCRGICPRHKENKLLRLRIVIRFCVIIFRRACYNHQFLLTNRNRKRCRSNVIYSPQKVTLCRHFCIATFGRKRNFYFFCTVFSLKLKQSSSSTFLTIRGFAIVCI